MNTKLNLIFAAAIYSLWVLPAKADTLYAEAATTKETLDSTKSFSLRQRDDNRAVELYCNNKNADKITLSIKDKKGRLIFSEEIRQEGLFRRTYHFPELEAGQYVMKVSNNVETNHKTIIIK